jgi:hypothetical protein
MSATRGIHIVWMTCGTWPPGDSGKPGHWSPLFDLYGRLKRAGDRTNPPDAMTYEHARSLMKEPAKVLRADEIDIVAGALGEYLGPGMDREPTPGKPGAMCYAAAIEPTHVHLLLGPVREDIGRFVGRLKGSSSSAARKHPANRDRRRTWASGYWKVFLFDDDAVGAVADYVAAHNTRRGLAAARLAWVTPLPG